jgi:hypothetical protein
MKARILWSILFCFSLFTAVAQYNFVVQNGSAKVYKTMADAYANSVKGDTIYLPGGSFTMPNVEKKLVLIGVGYHPDSTVSTFYTRINNAVIFTPNADSTVISGIHFASNVTFGDATNDATDYQIHRCRINGSLILKQESATERNINALISESIIDGNIDARKGGNIIVEKSIIRGVAQNFRGSLFNRCFFSLGSYEYWTGSWSFTSSQNCQIKNSVLNFNYRINWVIDVHDNINNNFINNIFAGNITFPSGTNSGTNNQAGVDLATVFKTIDGNIHDYSYKHDFRLKSGSPAIGAGTNGTDIGLYGGNAPFKVGGLPQVPHVRNVKINDEAVNGQLPIEITVKAQEN